MSTTFIRLLTCGILCLSSLSSLSAQEISLSGHVLGPDGTPIEGALVRLLAIDFTAVTGKDGRWSIQEGTPSAIFPNKVHSSSTVTWEGPGKELVLKTDAKTMFTVLVFSESGEQLSKQHINCAESASTVLKLPANAVLVGIESQACDRVAYRIEGDKAVQTYTTCGEAYAAGGNGKTLKDIVSFELPGYEPARIPLSSLVKPDELARPVKLQLSGKPTLKADPGSLGKVLEGLHGGETVELASGNYGTFEMKKPSGFSWWVSIKAAKNATPVFDRISLTGTAGMSDGDADMWICFSGIKIEDGVKLRAVRRVDIRDSRITSAGDINGSFQNIEKSAVSIRECHGVRIENCEITHTGNGINGHGNHLVYRHNNIHDISQDGIHYLGGHDLIVEYNEIHDMEDGASDDDPKTKSWNMHCDCIQVYPMFDAEVPGNWLADVTFRGNRLYHPEAMGWMIQTKKPGQLRRFLFENNITSAVPGYMFHFKDACIDVVFRFNSFILPESGLQYKGIFGRSFDTTAPNFGHEVIALPTAAKMTTWVECYGNIMGGINEIEDNKKLTRCDNNLYYVKTKMNRNTLGPGEKVIKEQPFLNPQTVDGLLAPGCAGIGVDIVVPKDGGDRFRVPLPAYDANGEPRQNPTCLGAIEMGPHVKKPDSATKPLK